MSALVPKAPAEPAPTPARRVARWLLLAGAVAAVIIVPYVVFGDAIEAWTRRFLATSQEYPVLVAVVCGALLAADLLAPIPSSLVSTAAGTLLGFAGGMLVSTAGLTAGCLVGFALGRASRHKTRNRWLDDTDLARLDRVTARFGSWALIAVRPVPVVAEASVFFAGMSDMTWPRFVLLTLLANLGVSAAYAAVGAYAATVNSFLLAFVGAVTLPGVAMIVLHRVAPNSSPPAAKPVVEG